jgi:hypothetical protein
MGGACSTYGEIRNGYKVLVGKPEGKRPLGIHRHTPEDDIRIGPAEKGWEAVDWIHMAQDRDQ